MLYIRCPHCNHQIRDDPALAGRPDSCPACDRRFRRPLPVAEYTRHRYEALGIRDISPNYYRLLGVDIFESETAMIAAAADRQMMYLRSLKNPDAQQLLNEVSAARLALLAPNKKHEYDETLRVQPGQCKLDPPPPNVRRSPWTGDVTELPAEVLSPVFDVNWTSPATWLWIVVPFFCAWLLYALSW